VFADLYRKGGIAGINKGVNAVALRQMTNWGSRYASRPTLALPPSAGARVGSDVWRSLEQR
jgi:hypothetical protein